MSPLIIPFLANVVILVPVAGLMLFGGARGGSIVFENRFPENAGMRTILGALWTTILLASLLGLFVPNRMAWVLVVQIVYKSLWLAMFVLPRIITRRDDQIPRGITITFAIIVATYPWFVPWRELLSAQT